MPKKINGCVFCIEGETTFPNATTLAGISNNDEFLINIDYGKVIVKVPIRHCPWCGVKLSTIPHSFSCKSVVLKDLGI